MRTEKSTTIQARHVSERVAKANQLQRIGDVIEHTIALGLAAAMADDRDTMAVASALQERQQRKYERLHEEIFGYAVRYAEGC